MPQDMCSHPLSLQIKLLFIKLHHEPCGLQTLAWAGRHQEELRPGGKVNINARNSSTFLAPSGSANVGGTKGHCVLDSRTFLTAQRVCGGLLGPGPAGGGAPGLPDAHGTQTAPLAPSGQSGCQSPAPDRLLKTKGKLLGASATLKGPPGAPGRGHTPMATAATVGPPHSVLLQTESQNCRSHCVKRQVPHVTRAQGRLLKL